MKGILAFFAAIFGLSIFIGIVALLLGADWSFLKFPIITSIASFAVLFIFHELGA